MKKQETIPLLYDHHSHVSGRAAYRDCVDLSEVERKKKAISMIERNCSENELNVVRGWNDSYYSFDRKEINDLPPVFIWNISGHGLIFNDKAENEFKSKFENPGIIKKMKDPKWVEKNLLKVSKFMMRIEGITAEKIDDTYDFLMKKGIYKTEDMLLPSEEVLEIYKTLGYRKRTTFWADIDAFDQLSKEAKEEIEGIKMFLDGALGPKTAAIKDTYLDGTNNNGVLIYQKDELKDTLEKIKKDKVSIHAIGDRAIDSLVDTLMEMEKKGLKIPEVRIEHAQFISEKTAEDAKNLGIKLSMQPNFSMDSVVYSDRLSDKYLKMNNPFRMLIDEVGFIPGEDLLLGSDGLPYGAEKALEWSLFPENDSQKLTLGEFVDGYCVDEKDSGYIDLVIDESEEEILIENIVRP